MVRLGIVLVTAFVLFSVSIPQTVSANSSQEKVLSRDAVTVDEEWTYIRQKEMGNLTITTIVNEEGEAEFSFNRSSKRFTFVKADYWTEQEERVQQQAMNTMKVVDQASDTLPASQVEAMVANKWYMGKWQKYKVTFEEKAAKTAVMALILSYIPYVGKVVATIATVVVAYNMKVGYFMAKRDYQFIKKRKMIERQHLMVFEDGKYAKVLKYETKDFIKHAY